MTTLNLLFKILQRIIVLWKQQAFGNVVNRCVCSKARAQSVLLCFYFDVFSVILITLDAEQRLRQIRQHTSVKEAVDQPKGETTKQQHRKKKNCIFKCWLAAGKQYLKWKSTATITIYKHCNRNSRFLNRFLFFSSFTLFCNLLDLWLNALDSYWRVYSSGECLVIVQPDCSATKKNESILKDQMHCRGNNAL